MLGIKFLFAFSLVLVFSSITSAQLPMGMSTEMRPVRVEQVLVIGNKSVDASIIKSSIQLQAGGEYLPPVLREKVRESINNLHKLGLFSNIAVNLDTPDSLQGSVFIFQVDELPTLASTTLKGNTVIDEDELREVMELLEGQVFSPASLERERQNILNLYEGEGHLLARVDIEEAEEESTGRVVVTFDIEEGPKVKVRDVFFDGNNKVKSRKLRRRMATKKKSWFFGFGGDFKQDEFISSLDSIRDYYRENGFLDAAVLSHDISYSSDKRFLTVNISVSEGTKYYFGKVNFIHNGIMEDKALASQILLDSGEVINVRKLEASKFQVEVLYRDIGHLFVQIQEQKSYRDSILDVSYTIQEGGIAHINKVHIRGNTKTKDKVIRRELKIFPGDIFSQTLVARSQREIFQLNFFDNVIPYPEPVGNDDVDLIFEVTEREAGTGTFSAGAAYSQRDALLLTLGLQIPNFLGNGQRADMNIEFGEQKKYYSIGFTEPWFLDTPTLMGASLFYQDLNNFNFVEGGSQGNRQLISYGLRLRLGRRLTWPDDYFSLYSSYNLTQNDNGRFSDPDFLLLQGGLESSVSLTLIRDDKDLPIFPNEGSRFHWNYSRIGGPLGGAFDYSRFETTVNWWFPTIQKLVLGLEAQFGVIYGDNIQQVDLYQMGGILGFNGKMRGYHPGSIGQLRIGRSFFSFVSELTYPVAPNVFYLLGFFDMGNVFGNTNLYTTDADNKTTYNRVGKNELDNPLNEVDLTDLVKDYGVGFRLVIPMVGIMGFDFAWAMDRENRHGENISRAEGFQPNFVIQAPF